MLKWSGAETETDPRAGGNNPYGCKDGNNGTTRMKGRILLCLIDFGRAKDIRLDAYSDLLQPCNNGSTTGTDSEVGMAVERGTGRVRGRGMKAVSGGRRIPHDKGRDRDRGNNGDRDGVGMKEMVSRERNCYDRKEEEEEKGEEEEEGNGVSGVVGSYSKSCAKNAFSYNVTVGHNRGMHVHCMHALSSAICYNLELILCNFPLLHVILLYTIIMLRIFLSWK